MIETGSSTLPLDDQFHKIMRSQLFYDRAIAVAVSGGPDSMALCALLSGFVAAEKPDMAIHAFTVDHRLRPESSEEAASVGEHLKRYPNIHHRILVWDHTEKPDSRLQEHARTARYDLIGGAMKAENITHLFLGHHQDDQAETILFRLAKGSGLDGLSGMAMRQEREDGIVLCRPLLTFSKAELMDFCEQNGIPYTRDPSNQNPKFARVRLRQSMDILAEEGLTPKRLAKLAYRLSRAQSALDEISEKSFLNSLLKENTDQIVLDYDFLRSSPEEIALRVLMKAMDRLNPPSGYPVRLERLEDLFEDLMKPQPFRKRTLSGIVFERKEKEHQVILRLEHALEH